MISKPMSPYLGQKSKVVRCSWGDLLRPYLSVPEPLETPENLPSMTHGMKARNDFCAIRPIVDCLQGILPCVVRRKESEEVGICVTNLV